MRRLSAATLYVSTVSTVGLLAAAYVIAVSVLHPGDRPWLLIATLVAALAFCELAPIHTMTLGPSGTTISLSNAFIISLVVVAPPGLAVLAIVVPCTIAGVQMARPWYRSVFNIALYTLSVIAARGVFCVLSSDGFFDAGQLHPRHLPAAIAVGIAFVLVNEVVLAVAIALTAGERVLPLAWSALRREALLHTVEVAAAALHLGATALYGPAALLCLVPCVVALRRSATSALAHEHANYHDSLTGLPNRNYLEAHFDRMLDQTESAGKHLALVRLDVARLRVINSIHGDATGDFILLGIGQRLRAAVLSSDLVVRLSDDNYLVCLTVPAAASVADSARTAAEALIECLENEPFHVGGDRVDVEVEAGLVLAPDHGRTAGALLANVEIALHKAKENRTSVAFYDAGTDRVAPSLLGELREAVAGDQLVLHYQPKVDLGTGAVHSVEALVRWQHPTRGLLFPDAFIDLAEKSHLIRALTWNVLGQALSQARTWLDSGRSMRIAVNMSALHLSDLDLPQQIQQALDRAFVPAELLILEVTEGSLMKDPESTTRVLTELRDLGVRIAMDDFGTGYSSLAYLHSLPIDELKIDRKFISRLDTNAADAIIVESSIRMATAFGMTTVAEGAENAATVDILRRLDCDTVQGYFYSRPLPAERLDEWLADKDRADTTADTGTVPEPTRL